MSFISRKFFPALGLALGALLVAPVPVGPVVPVAFAAEGGGGGLDADFVDDLQKGRELYRKRGAGRLEQLMPEAHPTARPMLAYWRARLLLRKGKTEAAHEFIAADHDAPFLVAELRRDLLRHLAAKKQWDEFAGAAEHAGTCPRLLRLHYSPPADSSSVDSSSSPDASPSAAALKVLWEGDFKFNDPLCNRVHRLARQRGVVGEDDVWVKLRRVAGRKNYAAARNLLRMFPVARYSSVRQVMRAPVRHIRGKHGLKTRLNRELVLIAAMGAVRSRPSTAVARWKKFARYFSPEESADVHVALGEWAARWGRPDALEWLRKAPANVYDENARAWRTRAALRAGDYDEVAQTIDAMPPEERNLTAWRYWRAVAARVNGDGARADALLKELVAADDFYGLLAREELGLPLVNPEADANPSDDGAPPLEASLALGLRELGLPGLARRMWRRATAAAAPADRLAAARLAAQQEWHLAAIYAADGVRGAAAHDLRFPRPYAHTIEKYADDRGLDRAFVYGLIRQESRFMPKIVSSAKARGLMQVMPATAKRVARRHGYGRYRLSRLTRVDTNVIIGTRYLADIGAALRHRPPMVAAAYNAGPARAKRWKKRRGADEWLVYIETIPITETRLYVKHVLANRAHYDHALGRDNGGKMREVIERPANRSAGTASAGRELHSRPERLARGLRPRDGGREFNSRRERSGRGFNPRPARKSQPEQAAEFGEEFFVVAGVAPEAVFAAAEVEAAGLGGDPDFAGGRLAVDNDGRGVVGADVQRAAGGVEVNVGVVEHFLHLGEDGVAEFVVFGFAQHDWGIVA